MSSKKTPVICALDLGSMNIRVILAEVVEGKPRLLSCASRPSLKINNGDIQVVQVVGEQLLLALQHAEELAHDVNIDHVYVNISGSGLHTDLANANVYISDTEGVVTAEAIRELDILINDHKIPANRELLCVEFCKFFIDNQKEVLDPTGQVAVALSCDGVIVSADQNYVGGVRRLIKENLGRDIMRLLPSSRVLPHAFQNTQDPDRGTLCLNLGYGTLDYSVYKGNKQYLNTLPIGLDHICMDLAECFDLHSKESEKLLKAYIEVYGSLPEGEDGMIELKGLPGTAPRRVSLQSVEKVVVARLGEMLAFVWHDICHAKKDSSVSAVLITGGGAKLQVLERLIPEVMGLNLSKAHYEPQYILPDMRDEPELWANCLGTLVSGARDYEVSVSKGNMPIASQFIAEFRRVGGLVTDIFSHLKW
ncbi:hypothetical protein PQO03_12475 [Lentisphaera profundi]|uniref:SHS2 domain-containing protein n=1 Tax=Lentisphaera profundi TaxID=1658616 RepID=A0ABY7W0K1_9BACT|nr:cell division FtsA domain-containing protein [Lentisphaera profundi]WDE98652.1 hypothetical protein PQO03_12475 [Lentisphaera profundi]